MLAPLDLCWALEADGGGRGLPREDDSLVGEENQACVGGIPTVLTGLGIIHVTLRISEAGVSSQRLPGRRWPLSWHGSCWTGGAAPRGNSSLSRSHTSLLPCPPSPLPLMGAPTPASLLAWAVGCERQGQSRHHWPAACHRSPKGPAGFFVATLAPSSSFLSSHPINTLHSHPSLFLGNWCQRQTWADFHLSQCLRASFLFNSREIKPGQASLSWWCN